MSWSARATRSRLKPGWNTELLGKMRSKSSTKPFERRHPFWMNLRHGGVCPLNERHVIPFSHACLFQQAVVQVAREACLETPIVGMANMSGSDRSHPRSRARRREICRDTQMYARGCNSVSIVCARAAGAALWGAWPTLPANASWAGRIARSRALCGAVP